MAAQIVHRGPDDDGFHVDRESGVALGARRLSVIDVAGGHQPMTNESGTVVAALSGEIYNFSLLREVLQRRGHTLRSRCDTEVLVHLYEDYGVELLHALEGMFAFVLWDAEERLLMAARDRFGEKPLFYAEAGGELALASEAAALTRAGVVRARLAAEALDELFVLGYIQAPRTVFEGVRQLPPGHLLTWRQGDQTVSVRPYWQAPRLDAPPRRLKVHELIAELDDLLTRSMRSRLVADVPLGFFLSGGVDSTLVAALAARDQAAPIKTFTVGYDFGSTSELEPARGAAQVLGSEHHELILSGEDVAARAPTALAQLDQPLADPAFIALHLLAEFARRSVTVAVGGEGADELLGGYPRYRWLGLVHRLDDAIAAPLLPAAGRVAQCGPRGSRVKRFGAALRTASLAERQLDWVTEGRQHARRRLYGPRLRALAASDVTAPWDLNGRANERGVAGALMRLDQMHWLPDNVLAKADRATMLASLEMRTPFLHRELAEFAATVPASVHLHNGGKALLRHVLRGLAGSEAADRAKRAFRVPAPEWLRGPLAGTFQAQLADSALYRDGWFSRGPVRAHFDAHRAGEDHSLVLWPLFVLGCWLDGGAGTA
jgi:asparagine synthase (glutamine-hydrolysing)